MPASARSDLAGHPAGAPSLTLRRHRGNHRRERCFASCARRASGAGRWWLFVVLLSLFTGRALNAAGTWSRGTGLSSNITLGALQNSAVVNRQWTQVVNYDLNLTTWPYDVYVPSNYDGTKPYGVMVYITSDATSGIMLQTASNDKNIIWIAPRNVGNSANSMDRYGAALLAIYRAKELFNIDSRRVYLSGKSGGARTASGLAFYHSEVVRGVAPSSGFALPRLNEVTPDYIPNTSGQSDTYFDYSDQPFLYYYLTNPTLHNSIETAGRANKLRSYIITRYDDYREDYFVEGFHCAFESQGQTCFLYDGPGTHQDATDAEMEEAIDYLDRDDIFPVNANITAGAGGFSGMANISQSGASAAETTVAGATTYTLTPTLTAVAAAKTGSTFYWDNANGSTVRWLWEVKNAAPTNQKTSFGLWFANETWGGGPPTSVTTGSNPGILVTITQNGSLNRMIISARPDSGGETVFYDGYFSFVPAYATAWTSTQTGYLSGTGSPVELRLDLNKSRWQLTFNGIKLDGTTNSIASGTQVSRDNKRSIFGYWETAVGGAMFWKHDLYTSRSNTWSPITKSIFTAATGALSGAGAPPSPVELRYVIASDPNLPDPPLAGPSGLAGTFDSGAVNLTWDAFANATGYTIRRSTVSGGPYTTIQSGTTGTSYSDSTVTAGTVYYYTIFATTAAGDTALAPELAVGAGTQVDTWGGGGADGNWQTTANWTTAPAAGHTLVFTGTTRLTNTNNFPANTSFADLMFNAGAGAFTLSGNAITLAGSITDNVTYPQTISLPVTLASGAHNLTANTGTLTMGGVISGSGSVSKTGSGTATLSTANTYGGGTTLTAGTLAFANAGALGSGAVTLNGGTLKAGGGFSLANNLSVSSASNFEMAGFNTTLSGSLGGSGALTVTNSGSPATMTFGDNRGYSGTLTINNGTAVSFNSPNAGSASAAWVLNDANAGRVRLIVGNNTLSLGSLAGSGQFVNNTSASTSVLSVGALNTSTVFAGTLKDNGTGVLALVKTGSGTLGLTGASTYAGGTTINGGTIGVSGANGANTNLGAGSVTVNTGAILRPGYSVTSNQNISTTANAITLAGGSIYADDASQHLSGAVTVSPSGGILGSTYNAGTNAAGEKDKGLALDGIVSGAGPLTIQHSRISTGKVYDTSFVSFSNNANPYSGTLTINENTTTGEGGVYLGINGGTALQNATVVTSVIPGGNLKFGTSPVVFATGLGSTTIGAISGGGPLVLTGYDQINHAYGTDAIALTVGGNNAGTTYSAVISGLGSLTKTGTGMLTLSATNTYSGATTVSGGVLNITGALGGNSATVTINGGGTLSGTGTVARATTVTGGGAISPGNGGAGAAGTLTLSGGLTLNTGTVVSMDLAGTVTSDKIAVGGTFSASGTTTINVTALAGFAGSGTYPLITGATGVSAANFSIGSTPAGYVGSLSASGGTLNLTLMTLQENWRLANFGTTANSGNAADGADPDGDGMTNAQEFAAGTDPNDSASVFRANIAINGNDLIVSFASVIGKTYRVERSDTLANGSWTALLDNIAGTGGVLQVGDVGAAAQAKRFYRVVLLP